MAAVFQRARFRVLSDVHCEFHETIEQLLETIPWDEENDAQSFLLLAGDIGVALGPEGVKYRALLAAFAARFAGLAVISGNHESYACAETGTTLADVDAALDGMCRELHRDDRPVIYLQKGEWNFYVEQPPTAEDAAAPTTTTPTSYHRTQLLGCTMWSPITTAASLVMNDAKFSGVSAPWIRAVHTEHVGWLRSKLLPIATQPTAPAVPAGCDCTRRLRSHSRRAAAESAAAETRTFDLPTHDAAAPERQHRCTFVRLDGSITSGPPPLEEEGGGAAAAHRRIVMTHHLPVAATPNDEYHRDTSSAYFADVFRRDWPEDAYPDFWICGHLHGQMLQQVKNKCTVFTVCHGYPHHGGIDPHRPTIPVYIEEVEACMRQRQLQEEA